MNAIKKPITVDTKVPEELATYTDDDALIIGEAFGQALRDLSVAGGELEAWSAAAEPYETSEGTGIRVVIHGQHRDEMIDVPSAGDAEVITLCGSSKFKAEFMAENSRLTQEGNVVISLGMFGHTDLPDYNWETDATDLKTMLDRLHMQKIRMADRVHVVCPGGYIGESTRREVAYARSLGKRVTFSEAPAIGVA